MSRGLTNHSTAPSGREGAFRDASPALDCEIYAAGRRTGRHGLEGILSECEEHGGFAWVSLRGPTGEEFDAVAREFGLHGLAVEDAVAAHQRPKVERYGSTLFVVLKPAFYEEAAETVEFGEIHAFVGRNFVVTVSHGRTPDLGGLRRSTKDRPGRPDRGPAMVLHGVMDRVVDGYFPVVEGLAGDLDEVEEEVFGGNADVSRRIYKLSREVIRLHRATQPLAAALERLVEDEDGLDRESRRHFRDAHDHVLRVSEQAESFRELLSNILSVNLTLVSVEQNARMQEQNAQVQKVSAWAAILVVPTIITGVYGMNFRVMPELSWTLGYPFALFLMVAISGLLYLGFRRSGWL